MWLQFAQLSSTFLAIAREFHEACLELMDVVIQKEFDTCRCGCHRNTTTESGESSVYVKDVIYLCNDETCRSSQHVMQVPYQNGK